MWASLSSDLEALLALDPQGNMLTYFLKEQIDGARQLPENGLLFLKLYYLVDHVYGKDLNNPVYGDRFR